jgi:hypothetical protein
MARVMYDTHKIYEKYRQKKSFVGREFRVDLERSQRCYGMAFMSSIKDGGYGAKSFVNRYIFTLQRMLSLFKTGKLPAGNNVCVCVCVFVCFFVCLLTFVKDKRLRQRPQKRSLPTHSSTMPPAVVDEDSVVDSNVDDGDDQVSTNEWSRHWMIIAGSLLTSLFLMGLLTCIWISRHTRLQKRL